MNSLNLQPEKEMFFLLSQFRNANTSRIYELLQTKLNWAEILGYLMFHRIGGLTYTVMNEFEYKLQCGQATFAMKMINSAQAVRAENIRKHLKILSEAFKNEKIPHAFLKGSVLASTLYPSGGRASNDIDVLVNAKDITKIGQILEKVGFQQGFFNYKINEIDKVERREIILRRMNWGEIVPYVKKVDDPGMNVLEIDINFSIDWLPVGTENIVEEFLSNTIQYKIGNDNSISSLEPETFLVHLCMHLYKEAILYEMVDKLRDLDFYKYVDIYAYIDSIQVDWEKFVQLVKKYQLQSGCYFALEYVRTFFPSLNKNTQFIEALRKIKPCDIGYLDEVIDPSKPDVKYVWQEGIVDRLFDMKRYEKLKMIPREGQHL